MQKKIRNIIFLIILFTIPFIVYSSVQIIDFEASRNDDSVIISWTTLDESNVTYFKLRRSTEMTGPWYEIQDKISSNNQPSNYTFIDRTIFKSMDSTYYYRLYVYFQDGTYKISDSIATCSGISGFRHTWGSIKAIFR